MLNVYAAKWCPHCTRTIEYLKKCGIAYIYHEIEEEPAAVVDKIIEVNGGEDWVVPTLEFQGNWIPGHVFSESFLEESLKKLGVVK